jgi:hypothetical protein
MRKASEENRVEIGVLLGPLDVQHEGTRKVSLEAEVVEVVSVTELRNPIEGPFEDLGIRLTVWPDPWQDVAVRYERVYQVDEARAQRMLRKLQSIRKEQEKFRQKLGNPADATDDFLRAVNAIGATWIVEKTAGTSSRYAENEYRFLSLQDGAGRLRHLLTEALAGLTAPVPQARPEPAPEPTPSA